MPEVLEAFLAMLRVPAHVVRGAAETLPHGPLAEAAAASTPALYRAKTAR